MEIVSKLLCTWCRQLWMHRMQSFFAAEADMISYQLIAALLRLDHCRPCKLTSTTFSAIQTLLFSQALLFGGYTKMAFCNRQENYMQEPNIALQTFNFPPPVNKKIRPVMLYGDTRDLKLYRCLISFWRQKIYETWLFSVWTTWSKACKIASEDSLKRIGEIGLITTGSWRPSYIPTALMFCVFCRLLHKKLWVGRISIKFFSKMSATITNALMLSFRSTVMIATWMFPLLLLAGIPWGLSDCQW